MTKLSENKTFMFLLRACVALLLICLVFNLCVMPSFASSSFTGQPFSSGVDIGIVGSGNLSGKSLSTNVIPSDVYIYSIVSDGNYRIRVASSTSYTADGSISFLADDTVQNVSCSSNGYLTSHGFYTGYYGNSVSHDTLSSDIPIFSSIEEALTVLADYIENSSKSIQTVPYFSSGSSSFGYQFASDVSNIPYYVNQTNNNFSCCAVLNGSLICSSLYSSAVINTGFHNLEGFHYSPLTLNSVSVSDGTLYYGTINFVDTTYSSDLKTYTDANTCYSDMYNYLLDNGGAPPSLPTGSSGDVVIPAGWVSYIQVSGGNMLLETIFPEYSNIIGIPAWNSRSTIQYGVSSLPVEGTLFSETSGTLINWAKSSQGKNILGQTKQAGYGVNNLEQSQNYIVIYNPANRQVSERGQGDISPTINAHFTELIEAKSYPLTQTFNIGTGETTSTSVSGFDNPLTTTPEGTTDLDGNPSTPNIGGSGADATYNDWSVTNYLQSIKETLDNFASSFMGLLQSPISHVRQLISAGSDYFQVIQGLYAWLPSPVQTTIESALIVSISIGVIGLLL